MIDCIVFVIEAESRCMRYNTRVIDDTRGFSMFQMQVARVDAILLLFAWMQRMEVAVSR